MPLREVRPLDEKQWKQVVDALKAGPGARQQRAVAEALECAKKLRPAKD